MIRRFRRVWFFRNLRIRRAIHRPVRIAPIATTLALAVVAFLTYVSLKEQVSFIVDAKTEVVTFTIHDATASAWPVAKAALWQGDEEVPVELDESSVKLPPGTRVKVQHEPQGVLRVQLFPCQAKQCPPGTAAPTEFWVEQDERFRSITLPAALTLKSTGQEPAIVIPFKGMAVLGQPVMELTHAMTTPILTEGHVRVLADSVFRQAPFIVEDVSLQQGDALHLVGAKDQPVESLGFLRLVWNQGDSQMSVTMHAPAEKARISRFGSEGYVITASWWRRLANDPALLALQALVGCLLLLLKETPDFLRKVKET